MAKLLLGESLKAEVHECGQSRSHKKLKHRKKVVTQAINMILELRDHGILYYDESDRALGRLAVDLITLDRELKKKGVKK